MNSNQRSEGNNQSNNGGNELAESSSRAFSTTKRAGLDTQQQPGQQPSRGDAMQKGGAGDSAQSFDRAGSQTGTIGQGWPAAGHESNDAAGGMPKSPGGANILAADQKMDDDTGLSNSANRPVPGIDEGIRQEQQSNVGRRSDGTPD